MKIKLGVKVWILLIVLLIALIAINPKLTSNGVLISSVELNSTSSNAGLTSGQIIKTINGKNINNLNSYQLEMSKLFKLQTINVSFIVNDSVKNVSYEDYAIDFAVENMTIINAKGNAKDAGLKGIIKSLNNHAISNDADFNKLKQGFEQKQKVEIKTNKDTYVLMLAKPEFTVKTIPKTRIKLGLDLQGGARALIQPEAVNLSQQDVNNIISIIQNRFNVYGITDVSVKPVKDMAGKIYILVEMAGATPKQLKELITSQGKFEAKINNITIFIGGKRDITSVCQNDPSCAGVRECQQTDKGYYCKFEFAIYLSQKAAEKQANTTSKVPESSEKPGYLNSTIDLYLDNKQVDKLLISKDLKGRATTQIAISGPGTGKTKQDAYENAQANMKKLQTILITGSLPVKLNIAKLDSISPKLGKQFLKSIIIAALTAILAVAFIIFLRYKKIILAVPVIITMLSEIFIILGVAALINWNLDLASIAGIIAAIGTGVDDQIVIIDEAHSSRQLSFKQRIKRAFFIILGSYATTFVAMLPLWWAGAGLLKGFALTTIIGISVGVFVTRPAFSEMIGRIKSLR